MTEAKSNVCYCGNYGGGVHTRSARCPCGDANTPDRSAVTSKNDLNLVNRLRKARDPISEQFEVPSLFVEAADEIERLSAERTDLHGALVRVRLELSGCPKDCSLEFHQWAVASGIKIASDALRRDWGSQPAHETGPAQPPHRTDLRLAGDIEYCLAKINPATYVHAVLAQVMADLRTPVETSPWQPIETAPRGVKVLTLRRSMGDGRPLIDTATLERHETASGMHHGDGVFFMRVTHWMPLPEPPRIEQEKT